MPSKMVLARNSTVPDSTYTLLLQTSQPKQRCNNSSKSIKSNRSIKTDKLGNDDKLDSFSSGLSPQKEKRFKCRHGCEKSFFKKCDRNSHERMHTDERPYECKRCGAKYKWRSSLRHHESKSCPCIVKEKPPPKNIAMKAETGKMQHGEKSRGKKAVPLSAIPCQALTKKETSHNSTLWYEAIRQQFPQTVDQILEDCSRY